MEVEGSNQRLQFDCVRHFPPGGGPRQLIGGVSGSFIYGVRDFPPGCGPHAPPRALRGNQSDVGKLENVGQFFDQYHRKKISHDASGDVQIKPRIGSIANSVSEQMGDGSVNFRVVKGKGIDHGSNKVVKGKGKIEGANGIVEHFGVSGSSQREEREQVLKTLRLFRGKCSELMCKNLGKKEIRRVDFKAKEELTAQGKLKQPIKTVGPIPGVEVGDEFYYRVELFIIGLHRRLQNGIDYLNFNGSKLATCVVATEGYSDKMNDSDILTYTGEGGGFMDNKGEPPQDQKLTGGNLALRNSMREGIAVRVVKGLKLKDESGDLDARAGKTTYVYDGLYYVTNCKQVKAQKGNLIFQFELKRCPDQPAVNWGKYGLKTRILCM
ncbi:hypothetical protein Ancab_032415 [Ancistrocladus abbreviatus]